MFGPTYYSFDRGRVHYVVLDNVFYLSRGYVGYIEESQLEWLERDLALVEPGSTVIVFMHIPTFSREARAGNSSKEESNRITANRNALYRILDRIMHIYALLTSTMQRITLYLTLFWNMSILR